MFWRSDRIAGLLYLLADALLASASFSMAYLLPPPPAVTTFLFPLERSANPGDLAFHGIGSGRLS